MDPLILSTLKPPITDLTLQEHGTFTDVTVEIRNNFAGILRVPTISVPTLLREVFSGAQIGTLFEDRVIWKGNIVLYDAKVVIDDEGRLHSVEELQR